MLDMINTAKGTQLLLVTLIRILDFDNVETMNYPNRILAMLNTVNMMQHEKENTTKTPHNTADTQTLVKSIQYKY